MKDAIEHGKAGRHERPPLDLACQQVLEGVKTRLDDVPGSEKLGSDAVTDPDVDGQHPFEHEYAGTAAGGGQRLGEPDLAGIDVEGVGGDRRPGGEPHPQVELVGQVQIEVQQVL